MIWIENDLLYFRKYNNDCIRIDMIKSYDNFFRKNSHHMISSQIIFKINLFSKYIDIII